MNALHSVYAIKSKIVAFIRCVFCQAMLYYNEFLCIAITINYVYVIRSMHT